MLSLKLAASLSKFLSVIFPEPVHKIHTVHSSSNSLKFFEFHKLFIENNRHLLILNLKSGNICGFEMKLFSYLRPDVLFGIIMQHPRFVSSNEVTKTVCLGLTGLNGSLTTRNCVFFLRLRDALLNTFQICTSDESSPG